nr:type II toxin-antitoxin system HicB family antitoxin [Acidisoma sp. S159]
MSGRHCRNPHQRPDYAGWTFGVITLDPALLDDTVERVNITLPRHVVKRLDALTRAAGESRSGYIAHLTLEEHEA